MVGGASRSGARSGGRHSSSSVDGGDVILALVAVVTIVEPVALIASFATPPTPFDGWLRLGPNHPLHLSYAGGASRIIALRDLRPSDLVGLQDTRIDAVEGSVEELAAARSAPGTPVNPPRGAPALNSPVASTAAPAREQLERHPRQMTPRIPTAVSTSAAAARSASPAAMHLRARATDRVSGAVTEDVPGATPRLAAQSRRADDELERHLTDGSVPYPSSDGRERGLRVSVTA